MIDPLDRKLFHVTDYELQRAHKFYSQSPTGQWDTEACLCIEAVLAYRGFEFETVSGCWIKPERLAQAKSVTAGETAHSIHNATAQRSFADADGCENSTQENGE
jgi:hypothetical protein